MAGKAQKSQNGAGSSMAKKSWELENTIQETSDDIFKYNDLEQHGIRSAKPWEKE